MKISTISNLGKNYSNRNRIKDLWTFTIRCTRIDRLQKKRDRATFIALILMKLNLKQQFILISKIDNDEYYIRKIRKSF